MPIVIPRTGELPAGPVGVPIPQEKKDAAWAAIIKAYVQRHPEIFGEKK